MNFDFKFEAPCRICAKVSIIECNQSDIEKWVNKQGYIQDLLHYLSAAQRELLISGTCGECFDEMFSLDDEDEENETQVY